MGTPALQRIASIATSVMGMYNTFINPHRTMAGVRKIPTGFLLPSCNHWDLTETLWRSSLFLIWWCYKKMMDSDLSEQVQHHHTANMAAHKRKY